MTRHSRIISPLPYDTATGAVSIDYASTHLLRGVRMFFKAVKNRVAASALSEMSDRQLADIGLTRNDVVASFASELRHDPTIELALRARTNTRQVRA